MHRTALKQDHLVEILPEAQSHPKRQSASLTGESTSIEKDNQAIKGHKEISDQKNMLFAGTVVTAGNAKAVILIHNLTMEYQTASPMVGP